MPFLSGLYRLSAQAEAAMEILNGAHRPFSEIVQDDLDRSLRMAERQHKPVSVAILREAGARSAENTAEMEAEAALFRRIEAAYANNWTGNDARFLRGLW